MGRNTGVEPVHDRFTAGCVHRFTNCASGYYLTYSRFSLQEKAKKDKASFPFRLPGALY